MSFRFREIITFHETPKLIESLEKRQVINFAVIFSRESFAASFDDKHFDLF